MAQPSKGRRIVRAGRWLVRGLLSLVSAVVGFLTLFQPPTTLFWYVRIGVTEWGYWLAPLLLLPLLRPARRLFGWSLWLLSVCVLLAQLPLLQARQVARTLPAQLDAAFGAGTPLRQARADSRSAPFSLRNLWRFGAQSQSSYRRLIYAQRDDQPLSLDFYHADGVSVAPLVVVIHGGSWQSGDSQQLPALNSYLAARGYAVASLTYRLAPQHRFPAARDDVVAAIGYLTDHAAELGIDARRIVLLGRSAGAQLALLVGYTTPNPAIRGVISFYGPTDMIWGYDHPANPSVIDTRGILAAYLGGAPDALPEAYHAASPIDFVSETTPPTLLIHGGKDEMVFLDNSTRLVERLAAAHRPSFLLELPWASHACDANILGPSGQLSTYAVEHFVDVTIGNVDLPPLALRGR